MSSHEFPSDHHQDTALLTHLDEHGAARMVDVGHKAETERVAVATGEVRMAPETLAAIVADVDHAGCAVLVQVG